MVTGVISSARIAEDNNIVEVDAACCGEYEFLTYLYTGLEPTRDQLEFATKVLIAACAGGRWRIVKMLVEEWKENKQGFCDLIDSSMALSLAAKLGHTDVVKVLLESRGESGVIDVNAGDALFFACQYKRLQVVDLLLQEDGINPNQHTKSSSPSPWSGYSSVYTTSSGGTPLSIARVKGHTEIVQRLLQHPDIDNRFFFNLCLYIANNKYTAGVLVCAFFLGFIVLIIFNYSDTTTCTCDPILNKYVYFEDYYLKNVYSCEGPNYEQDDNSDFLC